LIPEFLLNFLLLAWLLAAAWGLGAQLLRAVRLGSLAWGTHLVRLALGLGLIAHLTLLLGAVFPLSPALTWGLLALGGIACLLTVVQERRQLFGRLSLPRLGPFEVLLLLVIAASCLFALLRNGLLPPVSYDEVAYHLGIPQIYIQQGSISYIPFIPYSNWPLETEMLFLLALLVKAETLTHLVTWATLLLTCLGLVSFGRYLISLRIGLAAAAIFSSTIMVTSLSGTALIEMPLTWAFFLSVAFFMLWLREKQDRYWILSAVLAGLAASTKFNAAVMAAILGLLVLAVTLYRRQGLRVAVRRFAGFGLIAFLVVSPWYVKSWLQTGNPLWPFFSGVFPTRDWSPLVNSYLFDFIQSPNLPLSLPNFFYAFWLVSADYGKIGPLSFRLGWLYLAAILPAAAAAWKMARPQRAWLAWLAGLGFLFYVSWFFQTHQARFLMPVVPVFALAVAAGVQPLLESRLPLLRWAAGLALLGLLLANSWAVDAGEVALLRSNKAYLLGLQTREQYLSLHSTSYGAFTYANAVLPQDSYVLLALMESRGYYLDRRYMWLNPLNQHNLALEEFQNVDQFAADLARRGFTHILYNTANTDRYLYLQYGPHYAQLIRQLLQKYCKLMYTDQALQLYQFIPGGVH
jgi:4-amino-4-deoxy-L-arabinose transferase-like glycosyltransferase